MSFAIDCKVYLEEISGKQKSGTATESSYYPALEKLIQAFVNSHDFQLTTIVAPKKTESGMPDILLKKNVTLVGYLEAKDIPLNLAKVEETGQIKRYREAYPNLILTDFFTFWLYRNGEKKKAATLADKKELLTKRLIPRANGLKEIQDLLSLFCSFLPVASANAKQLATELAKRAKQLSMIVLDEISEKNQLFEQMYKTLKDQLIGSLTHQTFADMYSQTLAYGLFAAKVEAANKNFSRTNAYDYLTLNIPLLQQLFYLMQGPRVTDPLKYILDDIVSILNSSNIKSILSDFHTKTWSDDPVVHFYETFLSAYDPKLREKRGVYYTPTPIVAYIIKSIQRILVNEFAIVDGLADPRVLLLDPATGSLTFLALAIRLVNDLCTKKESGGIFPSLVRQHILKNYFGFELLLAPYVIGHLKAKLTLKDLGYEIGPNDRFQLYLTNALDLEIPSAQQSLFPELINEARDASRIKDQQPIVVICGNPPYSYSSDNKSLFIEELMKDYKSDVRNERNLQPLDNDYLKFLRFAQWKIVEKTHHGIVGMITANSYIDGLIHRGVRRKLLDAFNQVVILNLHGNTRSMEQTSKDQKDENVFEIQQGVAIVFLIKKKNDDVRKVLYADLWGSKEEKYKWLSNNEFYSTNWQTLNPKPPFFWFFPKSEDKGYQDFPSLGQIMPFRKQGVKTHRDWLVVGFEDAEIKSRIESLRSYNEDEILSEYHLGEGYRSSVSDAKKSVKYHTFNNNDLIDYLYRPFDNRRLYYNAILINWNRPNRATPLARQLAKRDTIFLVTRRNSRQWGPKWTFAFVTRNLPDMDTKGGIYAFPTVVDGSPNFSKQFLEIITKSLNHPINPLDILGYIYAILYCNEYRKKYSEDLRFDFPRIPVTADRDLFIETSNIGKTLVQAHLLEDQLHITTGFPIRGSDKIERAKYDALESRVYINQDQYFSNVSLEIWNYEIGGYRVSERWLLERLGRRIGSDEISTYMRIVAAIKKTIELQQQIDRIYPAIEGQTLKISFSNHHDNETLI